MFHAGDRLSGLVRGHHGDPARRNVIAKRLGIVDAQEDGCRRQDQVHQGHALRLQGLVGVAKQGRQAVAIALGDGIGYLRQRGQGGADRKRGAPLIVERGDHAVILQLELLFECELRQRALLQNRKGPENPAGHRDGQRNGEDQPGRDRSKFEHGDTEAPGRGEFPKFPENR